MEFTREEDNLVKLGLTMSQAKVYVGLLRAGAADAKTLARISNISRPDIYRIMPTLEKRGLVEVIIRTPLMFQAVLPEVALSKLLKQKRLECAKLEKAAEETLSKLKLAYGQLEVESESPHFVIIPKREAALKKRRMMIRRTESTIDVINSWKRFPKFVSEFSGAIGAALKRTVEIRVVSENPVGGSWVDLPLVDSFRKYGNFKLRRIDTTLPAVISIYDDKEALIVTSAEAGIAQSPLLWTDNESLMVVLKSYFRSLWDSGFEEV